MTYLTDSADGSRPGLVADLSNLDRTDRILLASCAVVWLAALGAGVAATVGLVDLATGHADSGNSGTPWFLYTVIGVSAAVIVAAVPLLLRARRAEAGAAGTVDKQEEPAPQTESPEASRAPQQPAQGPEAQTEKLKVVSPGPTAEMSGPLPRLLRSATPAKVSPVVDQLFLRFGAVMACAMGIATLLVGVATYLMAIDIDTVAWVLFGLAGVVTVGMVAVVWYFLREVGEHTADV